MADDLSADELELIREHRARKAASARKVRVKGKHDSGAEYEFDLDGDDAERVISRHAGLWAADDDGGGDDDGGAGGGAGGGGKPKATPGGKAKPAYFKRS